MLNKGFSTRLLMLINNAYAYSIFCNKSSRRMILVMRKYVVGGKCAWPVLAQSKHWRTSVCKRARCPYHSTTTFWFVVVTMADWTHYYFRSSCPPRGLEGRNQPGSSFYPSCLAPTELFLRVSSPLWQPWGRRGWACHTDLYFKQLAII